MRYTIRSGGFTLIELTLTLSIMAILATLASVSWPQLITSTRHTDTVNQIHRMFASARSLAVTRRTVITVCPLTPAQSCIDDWNRPVHVFLDADNDKRPDNGRSHQVFHLNDNQARLHTRTAGRGYFQFASTGMSRGTMGSIVVCSGTQPNDIRMSYLALNIGGRLRSLDDEDRDGTIRLPWGTTVVCS
ncbi:MULTISPECIES: GspH/FimT family pseudopilin [Marinobacter]|nr:MULTISPECIES: GspH/FimT family pseudopilin [Marinobacter]MCG8522022.1 GspH/FimT family pseudopilin [Pseudomonadales bacterium]MEC9386101.1 GspH/FimT family pseudopilin [Pseudomonadota bacterium]ERS84018.1 hypothetical protein Q672_19780 [Marinobacter sp. EVN1]MAC24012.1 prepilin-type cleavage/methylation domain-containing protein [Marinobacter sp.]MBH91225.1 prepilin-type cleavage/methylation domain-containing protein [Marinobacter sp.]